MDVVCAGALVQPGDIIVADNDGVVVVPRDTGEKTCRRSEERIAKEKTNRARLRDGELGLDFHGLRDKLRGMGVEFEE